MGGWGGKRTLNSPDSYCLGQDRGWVSENTGEQLEVFTALNGLLIQHVGDKVLRCLQKVKSDLKKAARSAQPSLGSGSAEFPGIFWEPLLWV